MTAPVSGLFPEPAHAYPNELARILAENSAGRTFDGLMIVPIGEDGDTYIAAGHIDPERFFAAVRVLDQWVGGAMEYLDETVHQVGHVQVAVVPHCMYQSYEDNDHPTGCNCDGPWITWGADTPDPKFPATVLDLS